MQGEIYTRQIKAIAANATANPIITPTKGKRLHGVQLQIVEAGTNTLAACMTALTEIRVKWEPSSSGGSAAHNCATGFCCMAQPSISTAFLTRVQAASS